jgi:hypothetical protein
MMKGRGYGYYRCLKCRFTKRTDALESEFEEFMLSKIGSDPLLRKVVTPGDTYAAEIRKVEHDLEALRGVSQSPAVEAAIAEQEAKQAELRDRKPGRDKVDYEKTGRSIGQHWASLDPEGKGKWARNWQMAMYVDRAGSTPWLGPLGYGLSAG